LCGEEPDFHSTFTLCLTNIRSASSQANNKTVSLLPTPGTPLSDTYLSFFTLDLYNYSSAEKKQRFLTAMEMCGEIDNDNNVFERGELSD